MLDKYKVKFFGNKNKTPQCPHTLLFSKQRHLFSTLYLSAHQPFLCAHQSHMSSTVFLLVMSQKARYCRQIRPVCGQAVFASLKISRCASILRSNFVIEFLQFYQKFLPQKCFRKMVCLNGYCQNFGPKVDFRGLLQENYKANKILPVLCQGFLKSLRIVPRRRFRKFESPLYHLCKQNKTMNFQFSNIQGVSKKTQHF